LTNQFDLCWPASLPPLLRILLVIFFIRNGFLTLSPLLPFSPSFSPFFGSRRPRLPTRFIGSRADDAARTSVGRAHRCEHSNGSLVDDEEEETQQLRLSSSMQQPQLFIRSACRSAFNNTWFYHKTRTHVVYTYYTREGLYHWWILRALRFEFDAAAAALHQVACVQRSIKPRTHVVYTLLFTRFVSLNWIPEALCAEVDAAAAALHQVLSFFTEIRSEGWRRN
jgi:hypothetical protein